MALRRSSRWKVSHRTEPLCSTSSSGVVVSLNGLSRVETALYPAHDQAYVICAAAGLSYIAGEPLQLGCKTYIGPRAAFMPQTAPRIERQSAPEGPHLRVLGQWTASQFARRGLLRELQAELARIVG